MTKKPLVAKSVILTGEKPNVGIKAFPSPNPNQPHRICAYLDGKPVMVAKRSGNGGLDINKLASGKIYAVAADAFSPVYEKDANGKPTKVQKLHDGMPLFSASGFYVMSSRDYPAVLLEQPLVKLLDKGEALAMVTRQQLQQTQRHIIFNEFELELFEQAILELLQDEHNLVSRFDADFNKRRKRAIQRAQEEAEDNGETYAGVEYQELSVSKRDGAPAVVLGWKSSSGQWADHLVLRQGEVQNDDPAELVKRLKYFEPQEALEHFQGSAVGRALRSAVAAGRTVEVFVTPAHLMRTSVSFKRKVANFDNGVMKKGFGDAVFIEAAQQGWVKALVSVLQMLHPEFPRQDYETLHYVAAPRQAEVQMVKASDDAPARPQGIHYTMAELQSRFAQEVLPVD
jgi:hypothetical protein